MIKRISNIIKREKFKNPETSGLILLYNAGFNRIKKEWQHLKIQLTRDGTFSSPEIMSMCSLFPKNVLDLIISELRPTSILDVGCGTGVSLKYFLNHNIDALGMENSALAIEQSGIAPKIIKHNLNKEIRLDKKFDLVWSFEVIEHINPDFESIFFKNADQSFINYNNFSCYAGTGWIWSL